jgi:hypothetical protein
MPATKPARPRKPDALDAYAKAGGPLPASTMNVHGGSFWAGYRGIGGVQRGIPTSGMRRAYDAGVKRAKAEPGLPLPASARPARPLKGA